MTVLLALGSAIGYGLSDFLGGLLSRRVPVWPVAMIVNLSAALWVTVAALVFGGDPTAGDWAWGALAGVGSGLGTAFLYRGLAAGRMGVVAPLSAVGAAMLPVTVGLVAGERPTALTWLGIAFAFPAIWLVSASAGEGQRGDRSVGVGVVDGLLAGLGFGMMFAALGQVPDSAGLGPLALTQAVSVPAIVVLAVAHREPWLPRDRSVGWAVPIGAFAAVATTLFLFATHSGLLAVASVLSSLYPAFTVLLAVGVLREHVHRTQAVGLLLGLAAVSLVAVG